MYHPSCLPPATWRLALPLLLLLQIAVAQSTSRVSVPANQAWTASGVWLTSGDYLTLEVVGGASATWVMDYRRPQQFTYNADGVNAYGPTANPTYGSLGQMWAQIRPTDSNPDGVGWWYVGTQRVVGRVIANGQLYLGCSDYPLADNAGAISVDVSVNQANASAIAGNRVFPPPSDTVSSTGPSYTLPACDFGYASADNRTDSCVACPPGTFGDQIWGIGGGASICQRCFLNHYCPNAAMVREDVQPCPVGTESAIGSVACSPCSAGTWYPGTFQSCEPCPVGSYCLGTQSINETSTTIDAFNVSHMETTTRLLTTPPLPCTPGTFQTRTGQSTCTMCPFGTYNELTGQSVANACIFCPAATASAVVGATSAATCVPCAAGSFASGVGFPRCTTCAAGSYQALTGQFACEVCPANTYSTAYGAMSSSTCLTCPAATPLSPVASSSRAFCVPALQATLALTDPVTTFDAAAFEAQFVGQLAAALAVLPQRIWVTNVTLVSGAQAAASQLVVQFTITQDAFDAADASQSTEGYIMELQRQLQSPDSALRSSASSSSWLSLASSNSASSASLSSTGSVGSPPLTSSSTSVFGSRRIVAGWLIALAVIRLLRWP